MANNDGNQSNYIPIDTEKVLFVEGLVNYILQTNSLPGILNVFGEHEESDARICDKNMRMAVVLNNNKDRTYTENFFKFLMDNNMNNVRDFVIYARIGKEPYFGNHPNYDAFLQYSIHLTQLAGKLCAQGFKEAPQIALIYIVKVMDFDVACFEYEITGMIARHGRGQSIYNIVLHRQHEELGNGKCTNPNNVPSSRGIIGVPGSSHKELTNLNFSHVTTLLIRVKNKIGTERNIPSC